MEVGVHMGTVRRSAGRSSNVDRWALAKAAQARALEGQHIRYCEALEDAFVARQDWVRRVRANDVTVYTEIRDWLAGMETCWWKRDRASLGMTPWCGRLSLTWGRDVNICAAVSKLFGTCVLGLSAPS